MMLHSVSFHNSSTFHISFSQISAGFHDFYLGIFRDISFIWLSRCFIQQALVMFIQVGFYMFQLGKLYDVPFSRLSWCLIPQAFIFHYDVFLDISFSQISWCHSAVLDDPSFRQLSFMSHDVSIRQILYFIQWAFMMFHSFGFHDVSFRLLFGETDSTRLHWKLSLVWITCLGYSWWVVYITDWDVPF